MPFNAVIFVAALSAVSSEMVEDSFVNLIYGFMFGWRTFVYALITASIILITFSAITIYYALTIFVQYIDLISKVAAILLGAIGLYWLVSSLLGWEEDVEQAGGVRRLKQSGKPPKLSTFLIALQFVSIEELEILLVLVPLIIASHVLEASLAATVGIVVSASTAILLRKNFERFVEGKLRYLKIISGVFLITLGAVLFLQT